MIDYVVPSFFTERRAYSGGMHTKVDRVQRAAGLIYRINVVSDISQLRSEFVLIEPLFFQMEGNFDLEALRNHPAKKVLYCSEMEVFR